MTPSTVGGSRRLGLMTRSDENLSPGDSIEQRSTEPLLIAALDLLPEQFLSRTQASATLGNLSVPQEKEHSVVLQSSQGGAEPLS